MDVRAQIRLNAVHRVYQLAAPLVALNTRVLIYGDFVFS
jgi:hypothetical protein